MIGPGCAPADVGLKGARISSQMAGIGIQAPYANVCSHGGAMTEALHCAIGSWQLAATLYRRPLRAGEADLQVSRAAFPTHNSRAPPQT